MRTLFVVAVVSLGLLGGCGPDVPPCNFNRDCPEDAVCKSGVCVEKDVPKPVEPKPDASVADAGVDAGEEVVDAGEDAGLDAGVDAGMPPPMMEMDAGMMCTPRTCASVGAVCGSVPDNCGGFLSCGTCSAPQSCGAVLSGQCGCVAKSCQQLNASCGSVDDGCGHALSCGMCSGAQDQCQANHCVCVPKTCSSFPAGTCGSVADGCGGTLNCGGCAGPQEVCLSNQCVCVPKTCSSFGLGTCGPKADGCGHPLDCGGCDPFYTCSSATSLCVCASQSDIPDYTFGDTNCDGIDGDKNAAIFLAMNGLDTNTGAFGTPVKTLEMALTRARQSNKTSIYVASGDYLAPTSVWPSGMNLYGGFSASWARSKMIPRPRIVTPRTGWVLRDITLYTTIDRVIIESEPVPNNLIGANSQALRLVDCATNRVRLYDVDIIAANGVSGQTGDPGPDGSPGPAGQKGIDAQIGNPDWAGNLPAVAAGGIGASAGGVGGIGGYGATNVNGTPGGNAPYGGGIGGAGGAWACSVAAVSGNPGAPGAAGTVGAAGQPVTDEAVLGIDSSGLAVDTFGYRGAPGASGLGGKGGGGGGGGGKLHCSPWSPYEAGGFGGAGGGAGFPGFGGGGGAAGGSSIALTLVRSAPELLNVNIVAKDAGWGGLGGPGGNGGAGGSGGAGGAYVDRGNGARSGAGGAGGAGGRGGAGGAGAPGRGGSSIGIWCANLSGPFTKANVNVTFGWKGASPGGSAGYTGVAAQFWGCP